MIILMYVCSAKKWWADCFFLLVIRQILHTLKIVYHVIY